MLDGRDPRLTLARPDLADAALRGAVEAADFVEPRATSCAIPSAPLTDLPDADAPLASELLLGEIFEVAESRDGWLWGRSARDGYVGYAPAACFDASGPEPTHRVRALMAHVYPEPSIKSRPVGAAPLGAALAAAPEADGFHALAAGGFVCAAHLAPLDAPASDWVEVAERFLGVPYLWGGRTAAGIDCSGLVQIARQAAGFACPRDSDMQEAAPAREPGRLRRGDLIFWRGHVGIMASPTALLHANARHMACVREPLAEAERRIEAAGGGPVTARRRWSGGAR